MLLTQKPSSNFVEANITRETGGSKEQFIRGEICVLSSTPPTRPHLPPPKRKRHSPPKLLRGARWRESVEWVRKLAWVGSSHGERIMMNEGEEIFISSDNPFADVGLPNLDQCLMQAELLKYILTEIERRGLSQSQAASLLGVSESQIRLLLEARLSKIPLQDLVLMVVRLGTNVTTFRQPMQTEPGHIMISLPQSA